jgi:hypothetical protein
MSAEFAAFARERAGWGAQRIALFDTAFARYWERGADLARRTRTWPAPRRRHVAVVDDAASVRPYVQLLNTSAWMLYGGDLDPDTSDAELLAYLLALGDRMAVTGEVSGAAVRTALWWLERNDEECTAFAAAAARSSRPDADALRATAAALPWLRRLHHDPVRRPALAASYRAIPGTGLLVPPDLVGEPPRLAAACERVAQAALARYRERLRGPAGGAVQALCTWLAGAAPPLLVMMGDHIVWDPSRAERVNAVRHALEGAPAAAVESIRLDLAVVERVTRAFEGMVVDPPALPAVAPGTTVETGYTYLHRDRRAVAYNLAEAGIERLAGPAVPYARLMLAARTAHEWAHLADAAGWVPRVLPPDDWRAARAALAAGLEAVVAAAPGAVRAETAADERALAADRPLGEALVRIFVSRLPDYRANLVARHLLAPAERETYVRQNVRTLRLDYPPARRWRLLVRYLFEYQYLQPALGMTSVPDPFAFFVTSTWFDDDFFAGGVLDAARFHELAAAAARLCTAYAVDPGRLRVA